VTDLSRETRWAAASLALGSLLLVFGVVAGLCASEADE
jgi:hypothetical protein